MFCVQPKGDTGRVVRTTFVCSPEGGEARVPRRSGPRAFAPDVTESFPLRLVPAGTSGGR